jgi:trehalose utilization protein
MSKVALCWGEAEQDRTDARVKAVYPNGIHTALADVLAGCPDFETKTATLRDPDQGLDDETLSGVDVIVWWGHIKHDDVTDENAERVAQLVTDNGVGLVPVHSAHFSKPFKRLMGTGCGLGSWREEGEPEHILVAASDHPIAAGLPGQFTIPQTEMYSEPFDVPEPDAVILRSVWDRGETFRSCCAWTRGNGRVVYVRPGHETYPIFRDENFTTLLVNAAKWAAQLT